MLCEILSDIRSFDRRTFKSMEPITDVFNVRHVTAGMIDNKNELLRCEFQLIFHFGPEAFPQVRDVEVKATVRNFSKRIH